MVKFKGKKALLVNIVDQCGQYYSCEWNVCLLNTYNKKHAQNSRSKTNFTVTSTQRTQTERLTIPAVHCC